jgi:hypothetical protein
MSAEQRALVNQRRCESYHAKKLNGPESVEKMKLRNRTPNQREAKKDYKRRL